MKTQVNISGTELTISAKLLNSGVNFPNSNNYGLHNEYKVNLLYDGKRTSFKFYDSTANYEAGTTELKESDLKNAAYCFVSDALAGAEDYENFCSEFGYEQNRTARKIHNACKKSTVKAENLGIDLYEAANVLQD